MRRYCCIMGVCSVVGLSFKGLDAQDADTECDFRRVREPHARTVESLPPNGICRRIRSRRILSAEAAMP